MTETNDPSTAERLIEVAGEIFAAKGNSATVREICTAAGCSVAAINYYFGDKQKLYVRCVEAACERKQRLFPFPDLESDVISPQEMLRQFLHTVMARMAAASNLPWQNTLMLREIIAPSEQVAEKLQQYIKPDFERLDEVLSCNIGSKVDTPEIRRAFATQIFARCMFFRTGKNIRRMLALDTTTNEDPQRYADELCDSILAQIQTLRAQGCDGLPQTNLA
jgi:TetR/AcrR family transcriptional regulator, regulator of cefoperazone and chloramphenicol sensitivity